MPCLVSEKKVSTVGIMKKFVIKRTIQMIFVLFLVSVFSFCIIHFSPGDPLAMYKQPGMHKMTEEQEDALREELGLNGSVMDQYAGWLKKTLQGDLGTSISNRLPVKNQIFEKIPATAGLMAASLCISLILAIPLGLFAGMYKNRWLDNLISAFTYLGISVPAFWFGIMLIILFSLQLGILPSGGMRTIGENSFIDLIKHAILPAIVLSVNNTAVFVRYIRSNTITQLQEEYVMTAKSKGSSRLRILMGHVLKNCLLPVITLVGSQFGMFITGSFIVESVFSWPGIGQLGMSAVNNRDYPMIMGITMLSCVVLLIGNFLADILYGFADPRIKQGKE